MATALSVLRSKSMKTTGALKLICRAIRVRGRCFFSTSNWTVL